MNVPHFYTKYDVNIKGRDFVVGDLHGSITLFNGFLKFIDFDKTKDRMFSVGDPCDRGEDSYACMKLTEEDWFYLVYSNHDELAEIGLNLGMSYLWLMNGGNWYYNLSHDEQWEVQEYVKGQSPSLISVQKKDGTFFHVIHAELYEPCIPDDQYLWDNFDRIMAHKAADGDAVLWGRAIYLPMYGKNITENEIPKLQRTLKYNKVDTQFGSALGHIYSGHTIVRRPTTVYGQTNLDTGAYTSGSNDWAGLTFTEPETGKFWTVRDSGVAEVQPLVIA